MILLHGIIVALILLLQQSSFAREFACPIEFQLDYTKSKKEPICYRLKGPERVSDTYRDCVGNLYNTKLFNDLNIVCDKPLWTEYKTSYFRGPYIDSSYTESRGQLLDIKNIDVVSSTVEETENLCVVYTAGKYVATDCNEENKNYRYCFVKPYREEKDMIKGDCDNLKDSWIIWSPIPMCLATAKATGGGSVRATWSQSEKICKDNGGTLLNRGWIYSNIPWLKTSGTSEDPEYPLGVIYYPENILKNVKNGDVRSPVEWKFADTNFPSETSYGSVMNRLWHLVNSAHVFYDVVCERPINQKLIELQVKIDEGTLILETSDSINIKYISCFTDSETFYPTPVKITREYRNKFVLKPIDDGYYWCIVTESVKYVPTESNEVLFIRVEESLRLRYAVEITMNNSNYDLSNIEKSNKWKKKLQDYIYYYTDYTKSIGEFDEDLNYDIREAKLKDFKAKSLASKEKDIIRNVKFKKVYRDLETVLVHVDLNPNMKPVPPGTWDDVRVIYMKPVYYCAQNGHYFHDTLAVNCVTYSCLGNFNDGYNSVGTETLECDPTTVSIKATYQTRALPEIVTVQMPTPKDTLHRDNTDSDSSEEYNDKPPKPTEPDATTEYIAETTAPYTTPEPTEVITVNTPMKPPSSPPTSTTTTQRPVLPPEEQLQQVMQDLESLLNNETAVISVDNIRDTFDQVDELLEYDVDVEIPGDLLHLLDDIGAKIDLNGTEDLTSVRNNIALVVAEAEPDLPVRGLRISTRESEEFHENAFNIIRHDINSTYFDSNKTEVMVQLPESVATSSRRISFVVFRNNRAFHSSTYSVNSRVLSVNVENLTQFGTNETRDDVFHISNTGYTINSRVISISVKNLTQFAPGEVVDIHFSPFVGEPERNESRTCAFWQFEPDGGGFWSQEGCTFIKATTSGTLDTCRCDHLTHFAEILIPKAVFSERNETILEVLTVIGCCLSIIGLTIIGLTAVLFRSWRRDFNNKIWLQLCIAIFLLVLCFLVVILAQFDTYNIPCMLIGVALHYSVLASFCWMLVAAVLSYRRLVLVFNRDSSHKLLKAAAFAWGAPCAVIGILLSVDPHSYAGRFEEKTPTGAFCYPSGLALWLAVFAPIIMMLLANWTLFVLIVRSVFASRRVQRHGDSHNEALRCASVSCLLVFLFGLPWIFGPFSFNVVAAYFFTITVTFQGFILFLFFILGNKKTRDLWLNKLKIRQTRKIPVTSSTYTNRTGTSARQGGSGSVENKISKPKSLVASDDSRFS